MAIQRFKINPFIQDMIVPVRGRQVRLSTMGSANDVILKNVSTGEILGTHLTTYKNVDGESFVKLFTANIALTFGLSSAGIKAFSVLLWVVQKTALAKDEVDLDALTLADFVDAHALKNPPLRLSQPTFFRGLAELVQAQIIARTLRAGRYFLNPNFVFNGDRIAFTQVISKQVGGASK